MRMNPHTRDWQKTLPDKPLRLLSQQLFKYRTCRYSLTRLQKRKGSSYLGGQCTTSRALETCRTSRFCCCSLHQTWCKQLLRCWQSSILAPEIRGSIILKYTCIYARVHGELLLVKRDNDQRLTTFNFDDDGLHTRVYERHNGTCRMLAQCSSTSAALKTPGTVESKACRKSMSAERASSLIHASNTDTPVAGVERSSGVHVMTY